MIQGQLTNSLHFTRTEPNFDNLSATSKERNNIGYDQDFLPVLLIFLQWNEYSGRFSRSSLHNEAWQDHKCSASWEIPCRLSGQWGIHHTVLRWRLLWARYLLYHWLVGEDL